LHNISECGKNKKTQGGANLVKVVPGGSTIIMDNATHHPKKKLFNLARRHGMRLLFLPPYSPDLNPIEKDWARSTIKGHLETTLVRRVNLPIWRLNNPPCKWQ
jgi:transposase